MKNSKIKYDIGIVSLWTWENYGTNLTYFALYKVLKESGKKISELASCMEVLPQVLVNAKVNNSKKETYMEHEEIRVAINDLEEKFSDEGRVLIRTSGTEPLVRVMIEGKDIDLMEKEARKLADLMEDLLQ